MNAKSIVLQLKKINVNFLSKWVIETLFYYRVKNNSFCIISNNCWGGDIYEKLKRSYNSPFVGLFINLPCYLKLLKDFDFYMSQELKFKKGTKYNLKNINYPIGILGEDIEIHFLHYKSEQEAFEKWNRRKNRMPKDLNNFFFKIDEKDFATRELILDFHALPYKNKVSFTFNKIDSVQNNFLLRTPDEFVLFSTTQHLFDIAYWLNNCKIKQTKFNGIINTVLKYPR